VTVNLGDRSYSIKMGYGLTDDLGKLIIEEIPDITGCAIVTSPTIDRLYGKEVSEGLSELSPVNILVPDGEEAKNWETVGMITGKFIESGLDRKCLVIALGGGAVGDIAGFASSIYLRGVRVAQVPTTLLGMLDSSIGGKTAANHNMGKNLLGSFHQPSIVLDDPKFLLSLPKRDIGAGLVEAVKHGVIANVHLFNFIQDNEELLLNKDITSLVKVIGLNTRIKSAYVEKDERDLLGLRAALNYGHTLGHAVERLLSPKIRHGEAVAIGMNYASILATKLGLITIEDVKAQKMVLEGLGLSLNLPELSIQNIMKFMKRDKKVVNEKIRFILPKGIGVEPTIANIEDNLLIKTLKEIR
jgi:3-dehydroquinate synthase